MTSFNETLFTFMSDRGLRDGRIQSRARVSAAIDRSRILDGLRARWQMIFSEGEGSYDDSFGVVVELTVVYRPVM